MKWFERSSARVVKLSEKLDVLKTVRMYICTECINTDIKQMPENEDHREEDRTDHTAAKHTGHQIDDIGDDTRRKAESKKPRVRQHIGQPARHAVQIIRAESDAKRPVFPSSAAHDQDDDHADDRDPLRKLSHKCRKMKAHPGD